MKGFQYMSMKRNYIVILITVFLIICTAAFVIIDRKNSSEASVNIPIYFTVEDNKGDAVITPYLKDNEAFVFLPSYADMSNVMIHTGEEVYIGDKKATDGSGCDFLELAKEYKLRINGEEEGAIRFIKSDNIAAVYINTVPHGMDRVYADKSHKEDVGIRIVDSQGILNHDDPDSRLKGRGNSTWTKEKKPFSIKLGKAGDILGMGEGESWNLIATDNVRNKLVLDFAKRIGMNAPDSEYTDLYINGEYMGMYLMTEEVEIAKNRLDIEQSDNSYLFSRDFYASSSDSYFITKADQPIEIKYPKYCDGELKNKLENKVQSMENAILSEDGIDKGTGKAWNELIDIDSWVEKYLVEEISANFDTARNSQYFYWESGVSDKIYAGPAWDYDLTLGNGGKAFDNTAFFVGRRTNQKPGTYVSWYAELYKKPAFYERLRQIYIEKALPEVERLLEGGIDEQMDKVTSAFLMDRIRWNKDTGKTKEYADTIKAYLRAHTDFLSSAWVDGVDYCTIIFDNSNNLGIDKGYLGFLTYTVKKGEVFEMPTNKYLSVPDDAEWYDLKTGELFDASVPVTEDKILRLSDKLTAEKPQPTVIRIKANIKKAIKALPVFMLVLLAAGVVVVDKRINKKEE